MDYWKYSFHLVHHPGEVLLAFLSDLPFDTFEETATGLNAYMPANVDTVLVETEILEISHIIPFTWEKERIVGNNWNEIWESNFHPIEVGRFCRIRADFHSPRTGFVYELIINPKMAFGTGHHETTRLMLSAMQQYNFRGKRVLDYGCGTGILAILASKMGAHPVTAIDIERESVANTLENARTNEVKNLEVVEGSIETVAQRDFDFILANINRNVLMNTASTMAQLLRPEGVLLLSGFLREDVPLLKTHFSDLGFMWNTTSEGGEWACLCFVKK